MRRAVVLLTVLCLLPACATTSAVMWAADVPPEDGAYQNQQARSKPETTYRVELASAVPLRVACTQTTRWPQVHTTEAYHTWGLGWRLLGGFLAAGEGATAAALIHDGLKFDRPGSTIAGLVVGADALATVALITLKDGKWRTRQFDGPVTLESRRCPDGVAVEFADKLLPVYEQGQLAPADDGWFTDTLLTVEGVARLHRPDGTKVEIRLTPLERCQKAQALGKPEAAWLCDPARLQAVPVP